MAGWGEDMVFSSLTFLFVFFPVFFALYFLVKGNRARNIILIFASLLFYAWGEPVYILLMLISSLNDYFFSRLIDRVRTDQPVLAKVYLVLSILVNLGLLGFFKYADFVIITLNAVLNLKLTLLELPLPIGISFYTFQTMSYTIDVYREKVAVQTRFSTLLAYVVMFPQLIAGPIVRYATVEHELSNRQPTIQNIADGLRRFIKGLGKKVIIANQVAILADAIFEMSGSQWSWSYAFFGIIAFLLQIYYDFSGYSDMAIGMGKMMGFNFLENFDAPYRSQSITEFWRRWHISLGTWFKDYVYIPLGGSRVSTLRVIFNLAVVWFLTGLWHGASWNYVLFGMHFFIVLVFEKFYGSKLLEKCPRIVRHGYVISVLIIGFTYFRIEETSKILPFLSVLLSFKQGTGTLIPPLLAYTLPYVLLAVIGLFPVPKQLKTALQRLDWVNDVALIGVFLISTLFLVSRSFNTFIYFRF